MFCVEFRLIFCIDDFATYAIAARVGAIEEMDVGGVGAMDVSRSEAQRAETNVIARSDDRATITDCDDLRGRRAVVAAGDYVRAKTPLRSVLTLTSIAPTPLTLTSIAPRSTSTSIIAEQTPSPLKSVTS
jgi:hypothetical protein